MSYALIDNASLTAIQRLLGRIEARGDYSTDGDIVAFEHLIEGVLFYNEVVCLDDYKPEHRESRHRDFPFIRFLDPSKFGLPEVAQAASEEAARFRPEIRGGEFADADFKAFLEQLKMHIVCTWDLTSSVYYLTLKMLGKPNTREFDKYSDISATIFTELSDSQRTGAKWNDSVRLFDSAGRSIADGYEIEEAQWAGGKTGGLTPALRSFVAALNWLAARSIFYSFAARHLAADTFLHPIRSSFQLHYMEKTGVFGFDFTHGIIELLNERTSSTVATLINSTRAAGLRLQLPFFAASLVAETKDPERALHLALKIREEKEFAEARHQLSEIREAFDTDDVPGAAKKATKLVSQLDAALGALKKRFGTKGSGGEISISSVATIYNPVAKLASWPQLPPLKAGIPLPEFMERMIPRKGFAMVYRNVASQLPEIWNLGETRRLLTSRIRHSDKPTYSPKTEDSDFRHTHSQWKSPM